MLLYGTVLYCTPATSHSRYESFIGGGLTSVADFADIEGGVRACLRAHLRALFLLRKAVCLRCKHRRCVRPTSEAELLVARHR